MAHHQSAKQRIRRNARRARINGDVRSRVRTRVRQAEEALASGHRDTAAEAFRAAESELAKGANRGVVSANKAARKTRRLAARLKAL